MGNKVLHTLTDVIHITRFAPHDRQSFRNGSFQKALSISILITATLLAACSPAAPMATNPPQQPAATSTPVPTATAVSTATTVPIVQAQNTSTPQQTAKPTALDPCQLITSQDASTLTGAAFGAGKEKTLAPGAKTCTYGSQTVNVFFVEVAQAADTAAADAAQNDFISEIQANLQQLIGEGFTISQVSNFADAAISATVHKSAGGITLDGSAFAFRKGTTFFGFSNVTTQGSAPTISDMQSEAQTVLNQLP